MANREFSDMYAYDISKNVISEGEVTDIDAINQSIEAILSTGFGERFFNPYFGSVLADQLFESITESNGEVLLDKLFLNIEQWEDRVTMLKDRARLGIDPDTNSIELSLPYVINRSGIVSSFDKKVRF